MKIFISHKKEDATIAEKIAVELEILGTSYYLDVLDPTITQSGKALTDHIRKNLNDCTDIIVIMSSRTLTSQWVPFEVGMSAQRDMPTATFLQSGVNLPEFLEYWPRLKAASDIRKYVAARNEVQAEYRTKPTLFEALYSSETERFYSVLKRKLL